MQMSRVKILIKNGAAGHDPLEPFGDGFDATAALNHPWNHKTALEKEIIKATRMKKVYLNKVFVIWPRSQKHRIHNGKIREPTGRGFVFKENCSFYKEKSIFETINEVVNDAKFVTDTPKMQHSFLIVDKNMLNLGEGWKNGVAKKWVRGRTTWDFTIKSVTLRKGIAGNIKLDIRGSNDVWIQCMDNICK